MGKSRVYDRYFTYKPTPITTIACIVRTWFTDVENEFDNNWIRKKKTNARRSHAAYVLFDRCGNKIGFPIRVRDKWTKWRFPEITQLLEGWFAGMHRTLPPCTSAIIVESARFPYAPICSRPTARSALRDRDVTSHIYAIRFVNV